MSGALKEMLFSSVKTFPFIFLFILFQNVQGQENVLRCKNGTVEFLSEAPLETIRAKSNLAQGVISTQENEFLFEVAILSFNGFNSQLQREHFFENYMETSLYPKAFFAGKLIEEVDWSSKNPQSVRAKGDLNIHGVSHQRILIIDIIPEGEGILLQSEFEIAVKDHDIYIPRMVEQKISPIIKVRVHIQIQDE